MAAEPERFIPWPYLDSLYDYLPCLQNPIARRGSRAMGYPGGNRWRRGSRAYFQFLSVLNWQTDPGNYL